MNRFQEQLQGGDPAATERHFTALRAQCVNCHAVAGRPNISVAGFP